MRDLLRSAIAALAFTAMACGGSETPPGGGNNGSNDGGDTTDDGMNPGGDGPAGTCEWDENGWGYPFPGDPDDPTLDPDCNPLIPCINEDDDDHEWRDVQRDDGMPLRTGFGVHADVGEPACAFYWRNLPELEYEAEIHHAPGDACIDVSPPMVLAGDRLYVDVTEVFQDQRWDVVAEGQVLDNGTRIRYTILEGVNGPVNWTFEIERLPLPPGVTQSARCLPPP